MAHLPTRCSRRLLLRARVCVWRVLPLWLLRQRQVVKRIPHRARRATTPLAERIGRGHMVPMTRKSAELLHMTRACSVRSGYATTVPAKSETTRRDASVPTAGAAAVAVPAVVVVGAVAVVVVVAVAVAAAADSYCRERDASDGASRFQSTAA